MMGKNDGEKRRGLFGAKAVEAAPALAVTDDDITDALQNENLVRNLNLKALAAAVLTPLQPGLRADPELCEAGRGSCAPQIADTTSPWFAYWARELRCEPRPDRKLWEAVTVLQAFYEADILRPGARALGFGVGAEPLPSYLASIGLDVVATDLPGVADPALCWKPDLIAQSDFDIRVEVSNLDIRRLDDPTLRGFDACWSCSVLDSLASQEQAADAAILTMDTLRPGGVAVHITEFAFAENEPAEHAHALCFPRPFFEKLAHGLNGRGHRVAALDFDLGAHPLDRYVDLEPFDPSASQIGAPHLKALLGGELRTSFALVVAARA